MQAYVIASGDVHLILRSQLVVARFSGKWAMLVLCVLSENDTARFNAIAKAIPDISPKVLTETLKSLEKDNNPS